MKVITIFILLMSMLTSYIHSQTEPYTIELERITMPGTPLIHSFAFAEANGKWLFVGGRTNGLHGFDPGTAFPKQYSNKNIFVVDPSTVQTWSRNIFANLSINFADPLRSTNMQFVQVGNKLFITGGYGYDSTSNGLITFPVLTVIDVAETIDAISNGTTIAPYVRQLNDQRLKICGGAMQKLGDYFYLVGGHDFNGTYSQTVNDQVYSNQIRRFKINDAGGNLSISDYSALTDTVEYHRRDMNVVPAIRPDGTSEYIVLYGGVFRHGADLPFLNPIYIDGSGAVVDNTFSQKMSQYTCAFLSAFNSVNGDFHTTFFGGMSLWYYNEITHQQEYDSLVPFINDVTTLSKTSGGISHEVISSTKLPALLGTNSQFIVSESVPRYSNGVLKLNEISGRTFAGYIFGGIRALLPNNTPSFPSDYIMKVYITPKSVNITQTGNNVPDRLELKQNFPNPFNPSTKIKFNVASDNSGGASPVKLVVFNSLGEEVTTLVDKALSPGTYEVKFDGSMLSSGVYFYKLISGNFTDTRKMFLLK